MPFEPNATQAQALLRLLFIPEEPAMSKLKPNLPADKRKSLVDAGLISLEKRGNAKHVVLTDHGWAWAASNMDKLCPKSLNRLHPEILAAMLGALGRNMALRELSLAEIARPELFLGELSRESETASQAAAPESSRAAIRGVCLDLTESRPGGRVRLADLRESLPRFDRSTLDAALLEMQANNEIVLGTLERYEIKPTDNAAAVQVAGLPRHVIYLKNR